LFIALNISINVRYAVATTYVAEGDGNAQARHAKRLSDDNRLDADAKSEIATLAKRATIAVLITNHILLFRFVRFSLGFVFDSN
jgi:hypothetical protein